MKANGNTMSSKGMANHSILKELFNMMANGNKDYTTAKEIYITKMENFTTLEIGISGKSMVKAKNLMRMAS